MGFLDRLFGSPEDNIGDVVTIPDEIIKEALKETIPSIPDEKVERVVESIKSNLVPLGGNQVGIEIDRVIDIFNEELSDLYEPIQKGGNRLALCKQIDEFVKANPEISNSVKLMASYIAYGSSDITIEDYKSVIVCNIEQIRNKALEHILRFEENSKIKRLVYRLAQDLVKYEDAFLEKVRNKEGKIVSVKYLPSNTMIIKYDPISGEPVAYYQVLSNSDYSYVDEDKLIEYDSDYLGGEKKVIEFKPEDIVHINNGSPVGISDSPMLSMAILWKFLKLLEESLVIHRVTRAKRFIIFFVDVTGKDKIAARKTITTFTAALKRVFSIDPNSGSILSRNSTIQAATDLVIPVTKDSATKVQTIPSDPSATKIDDLKFYTNRLLTNFMTSWIFYPERTGKEELQKEAFIRLVKIYQKHMSYALTDLYREYLRDRGIPNSVLDIKIQFPNPDTQAEVKVIDVVVRRMMIVNQVTALLGVTPPIRWVVRYVFRDLSQTEIEELVSLIEQEIQKQKEQAKGQELPSIFEKAGMEESESSVLDQIIKISEFFEEDMISDSELEKVREKSNVKMKVIQDKEKELGMELFNKRQEAINQALKYLEMSKLPKYE